jgi:hypothetical protein
MRRTVVTSIPTNVIIDVDDVKHETPKAMLVSVGGADHWMPKSQITKNDAGNYVTGDKSGKMVVSSWIAKEKGLLGGEKEEDSQVAMDEIPF